MCSEIQKTQIKEALASVVEDYGIELKREGVLLKGLCPFHGEKTASFFVNEEKCTWKCFGCGEYGDVFTFIMKMEGCDFPTSIKIAADKAGIKITSEKREYTEEEKRLHRYTQLYEAAASYYKNNLKGNGSYKGDKDAQNYLAQRGLGKVAETLNLGVSLPSAGLTRFLIQNKKATGEELVEAGLSSKDENGNVYDRFRGRIMFPIRNEYGYTVGFGAREYKGNDKTAKYINSPETEYFKKGTLLYNLDKAKKFRKEIILVEGYADAASLIANDIENVVASLGTAFTAEQAKLLGKYTKSVVICYDADDAGQKATLKALKILRAEGISSRIVVLPKEEDPDSFIRKNGAEAFGRELDNAKTDVEFILEKILADSYLLSYAGRKEYVLRCVKILKTADEIDKDYFVDEIADRSGFRRKLIRKLLKD